MTHLSLFVYKREIQPINRRFRACPRRAAKEVNINWHTARENGELGTCVSSGLTTVPAFCVAVSCRAPAALPPTPPKEARHATWSSPSVVASQGTIEPSWESASEQSCENKGVALKDSEEVGVEPRRKGGAVCWGP